MALAAGFALAAGLSSFLVLRQAPVAPEAHAGELAEIRPLVQGEKLLFLGRDNFILYELRGSKPFTSVRNFYDPYYVKPNTELENVFSKFDFDSVTAETLARFPYVLATRAAYASGAPPGYRVVKQTDSYALWQRGEPPLGRRPAELGAEPGRTAACPQPPPAQVGFFERAPVVSSDWSSTTVTNGAPATLSIQLPPGSWDLSLQYDSTRPLRVSVAGETAELPANLDYRGAAPFWRLDLQGSGGAEATQITVEVEGPPLAGRLLGAESLAHLGAIAATAPRRSSLRPDPAACRRYVDWYQSR